ncbi:unnamed protein product, partial [Didymodactylos carnosus]
MDTRVLPWVKYDICRVSMVADDRPRNLQNIFYDTQWASLAKFKLNIGLDGNRGGKESAMVQRASSRQMNDNNAEELPPIQRQRPRIAFDDDEGDHIFSFYTSSHNSTSSSSTEQKGTPHELADVDRHRRPSEAINQHSIHPNVRNRTESSSVEPHMGSSTFIQAFDMMQENLLRFVFHPIPKDSTGFIQCRLTRDKHDGGIGKRLFPTYSLQAEREGGKKVHLLAARKRGTGP